MPLTTLNRRINGSSSELFRWRTSCRPCFGRRKSGFIGSEKGKIYLLNPADGRATEQPIKLPKPSPSTRMQGGSIPRLVGFNAGSMFGVLLGATEARLDGSKFAGTPAVQGYVLRLDGNTWSPTAGTGLQDCQTNSCMDSWLLPLPKPILRVAYSRRLTTPYFGEYLPFCAYQPVV